MMGKVWLEPRLPVQERCVLLGGYVKAHETDQTVGLPGDSDDDDG